MAMSKNGTISSGNTGTAGYSSFPARSFTPQKQPMPSDQKAKLLAMHADGKQNAGMYVAVVLVVYFILVIILLCRYGKRRRTSEPNSGIDSAAEQGHLQLFNFHIGKLTSCDWGGDGCLGNLSNLCFGKCQRVETSSAKQGVHAAQNGSDGDKGSTTVRNRLENDKQLQKRDDTDGGNDNGKYHAANIDLSGKTQQSTQIHDDQEDDDSEESLEDD